MQKKLVKGPAKIAGVCSGLAHYFEMDPTVVRLIFLFLLLGLGTGLLLYLVLAIIMPQSNSQP
ncbi:MAG: hypothetical protein RIQ89_2369 [Bacteroidota bacterium]|jgi:phage shock protein C